MEEKTNKKLEEIKEPIIQNQDKAIKDERNDFQHWKTKIETKKERKHKLGELWKLKTWENNQEP